MHVAQYCNTVVSTCFTNWTKYKISIFHGLGCFALVFASDFVLLCFEFCFLAFGLSIRTFCDLEPPTSSSMHFGSFTNLPPTVKEWTSPTPSCTQQRHAAFGGVVPGGREDQVPLESWLAPVPRLCFRQESSSCERGRSSPPPPSDSAASQPSTRPASSGSSECSVSQPAHCLLDSFADEPGFCWTLLTVEFVLWVPPPLPWLTLWNLWAVPWGGVYVMVWVSLP